MRDRLEYAIGSGCVTLAKWESGPVPIRRFFGGENVVEAKIANKWDKEIGMSCGFHIISVKHFGMIKLACDSEEIFDSAKWLST